MLAEFLHTGTFKVYYPSAVAAFEMKMKVAGIFLVYVSVKDLLPLSRRAEYFPLGAKPRYEPIDRAFPYLRTAERIRYLLCGKLLVGMRAKEGKQYFPL